MLYKPSAHVRHADTLLQWGARSALAFAAVFLIYGFSQYLGYAVTAVRFPFELDYGEGIVWQQMRLIMAGQGYGPIDHLPAIVFHYPPLFHVLSSALASTTGLDELAAGRLLSIIATFFASGFICLIVVRLTRAETGQWPAWIGGVFAALMMFSTTPVVVWSMLMRVDMLSLALNFGGVYLALRAITQPRAIYFAALCFVAAIYSRQTAIAAPAAAFLTLLFLQPRTAWAGIAACLGIGLPVAAALMWFTNDGFLRHILLYNINRIDFDQLIYVLSMAGTHAIYLIIAVIGVVYRIRRRLPDYRNLVGIGDLRQRLIAAPLDACFFMIVLYFLFATLMTIAIMKSGSSINYFIEWGSVIALFAGVSLTDAVKMAMRNMPSEMPKRLSLQVPLGIAIQAFLLPNVPDYQYQMQSARVHELNELVRLIQAARRPVISDDMVILLRANRRVQWEPAIFAELASKGAWNELPFIAKIRDHQFAFFITVGDRGDRLFDSRYNPAVIEAMESSYPFKQRIAGYTVHFPGKPPQPMR